MQRLFGMVQEVEEIKDYEQPSDINTIKEFIQSDIEEAKDFFRHSAHSVKVAAANLDMLRDKFKKAEDKLRTCFEKKTMPQKVIDEALEYKKRIEGSLLNSESVIRAEAAKSLFLKIKEIIETKTWDKLDSLLLAEIKNNYAYIRRDLVILLIEGERKPEALNFLKELTLLLLPPPGRPRYLRRSVQAALWDVLDIAIKAENFHALEVMGAAMGGAILEGRLEYLDKSTREKLLKYYQVESSKNSYKVTGDLDRTKVTLVSKILTQPTLTQELKHTTKEVNTKWQSVIDTVSQVCGKNRLEIINAHHALDKAVEENRFVDIFKVAKFIMEMDDKKYIYIPQTLEIKESKQITQEEENEALLFTYFHQVQHGNINSANKVLDWLERRNLTSELNAYGEPGISEAPENVETAIFILAVNKSTSGLKLLARHLKLCPQSDELFFYGRSPLEVAAINKNHEAVLIFNGKLEKNKMIEGIVFDMVDKAVEQSSSRSFR